MRSYACAALPNEETMTRTAAHHERRSARVPQHARSALAPQGDDPRVLLAVDEGHGAGEARQHGVKVELTAGCQHDAAADTEGRDTDNGSRVGISAP